MNMPVYKGKILKVDCAIGVNIWNDKQTKSYILETRSIVYLYVSNVALLLIKWSIVVYRSTTNKFLNKWLPIYFCN